MGEPFEYIDDGLFEATPPVTHVSEPRGLYTSGPKVGGYGYADGTFGKLQYLGGPYEDRESPSRTSPVAGKPPFLTASAPTEVFDPKIVSWIPQEDSDDEEDTPQLKKPAPFFPTSTNNSVFSTYDYQPGKSEPVQQVQPTHPEKPFVPTSSATTSLPTRLIVSGRKPVPITRLPKPPPTAMQLFRKPLC